MSILMGESVLKPLVLLVFRRLISRKEDKYEKLFDIDKKYWEEML